MWTYPPWYLHMPACVKVVLHPQTYLAAIAISALSAADTE